MGQNLTGQTISSTYEDLVQISGSILTNGLGVDITSVSVTASNAVSSSYAVTASYALNAGGADTGSLMVTGSATNNVLTFTKGDGSTFNLTVATGSAVTVNTGSLLVTASISNATTTYTKGDGSTFSLTVNNVQNASTASTAGTAGYAFTAGTAGFATSASFASQAGTAGFAATAGTAGFATSASFADQSGTAGFAATASNAERVYATGSNDSTAYSVLLGETGFVGGDFTTVIVDSNQSLAYNPGNGTLTATIFNGNLSGNASTATTASYALTASSLEGGVSLQKVLDTGNSAAQNLILTGSAIITGSLRVIGPQTGLLRNLESIEIFATSSTNSVQPNILIGAQNPTVLGLNTGLGTNNVVIGTGEFLTDAKGLASGSGNSNTVVGGFGGVVYRGSYNTIVGGGLNTISSGSTLTGTLAGTYNFMGGGNLNTIGERSTHGSIIGGSSNAIVQSGSNGSVYSSILGGQTNYISGSDYAGILASRNSDITFGNNVVIVGGNNLTANYATATTAYSAMLGGNGNTLGHTRSVVIGGLNLASTKNDEVVVPNLTISGSSNFLTFADGTTLSTKPSGFPFTGSAGILGNVNVTISGSNNAYLITSGSFTGSAVDNISNITGSTQVKHVAYCTQAQYNAITPDSETLYFISGSGNVVEDLTVTGSLLGNVSALSITSNTASLDLSTGNFFTLQLVSGSNTYINPTNISAGQTINLRVNTTGSATVSFPTSVKQVTGSAYIPTTTTGVDIVTFISFDTSSLYLSNVKNLV